MIKRIKMHNFKSFGDIDINFLKSQNIAKKLVIFYGENGSGKSNIISSISFLQNSLKTLLHQEMFNKMIDNEKIKELDINYLKRFVEMRHSYLEKEISVHKTIDSTDNMILEYTFTVDEKDVNYYLEFDNNSIVKEKLYYVIEKNKSEYFLIDKDNIKLNKKIFIDNNYHNELVDKIKKMFGKHTLMAILNNELSKNNKKYFNSKVDEKIFKIIDEILDWCIWYKFINGEEGSLPNNDKILENLQSGLINDKYKDKIYSTEKALNMYFSSLYSDIKSVKYHIEENDGNIKYKLYFNKMISNNIREIPFDYESTGTIKLLDIFPYFYGCINKKTVFIDEIDSGIHDLLMNYIIRALYKDINGQLIMTTHNTLLMKETKSESLYIIDIDLNGEKIVKVADDENRIQKNNNATKKYLSGAFGGVPIPDYIDFSEIRSAVNYKDE